MQKKMQELQSSYFNNLSVTKESEKPADPPAELSASQKLKNKFKGLL